MRTLVEILDDVLDEVVVEAGKTFKVSIDDRTNELFDEISRTCLKLDDVIVLETLMGPRRRGRTKRLLKLREMERKLASVQATIDEMAEDPEGKPRVRRGRKPKPKLCLVEGCDKPMVENGLCREHLQALEKAKEEISPRVIRRRRGKGQD